MVSDSQKDNNMLDVEEAVMSYISSSDDNAPWLSLQNKYNCDGTSRSAIYFMYHYYDDVTNEQWQKDIAKHIRLIIKQELEILTEDSFTKEDWEVLQCILED